MKRVARKYRQPSLNPLASGRVAPGQTLVELLVVVFIISLLVTMLMPALQRSIREAASAVCKANLREIHKGLQIYRYESGGWIPTGVHESESGGELVQSMAWFRQLAPRYLGNLAVFACPDDPMANDVRATLIGSLPEDPDLDLSSYGLSDFLMSEADGALANLDRYFPRRPWDTLLVADLGTDFIPATTGARSDVVAWLSSVRSDGRLLVDDGYDPGSLVQKPSWLTDRHLGGINLITVGGDIRFVRTQTMMVSPVQSYYEGCSAAGCALCNTLGVPHYSLAAAGTYWWTGTLPED